MANTKEIKLPAPVKSKFSLDQAMQNRRSKRNFSEKELSLSQISQLLWAGQGITSEQGKRTAPSAGALYPMELYLLTKEGLYHYIPRGHKLKVVSESDLRRDLSASARGQSSVADAPLDIIICAVFSRVTGKYGERGVKYAYIEAGHIAQNIHLEAEALGLGSVPVGAFSDEEVSETLNLPEDTEPIYIIPVGY
ncbi:MAG: SagB/ThcOx family dehydrogenase [Candidatus Omnitrophota bacterium]